MRAVLSLLLLLPACVADPDARVLPADRPGSWVDVTLLGGGFVRFEGARIPFEEFLLQMRWRLRAADWDRSKMPGLRIYADPGFQDDNSRTLGRIVEDLGRHGLPHIVQGGG